MSPQTGWILQEEVVPRLRSVIPQAVSFIGSEDAQELIQDATAIAARILHNAEAKGKKVASSSVAYYSIQHCRSGRRSVGNSCSDVHGSGTQINGKSRLKSLDEAAAIDEENGGEIFEFHDILSNDAKEDPSMAAARNLDWQSFCAGLSKRERTMVVFVSEGKTLRDAAHVLKVSDSTMQNSKRNLGVKILEFMGLDILVQVQRLPGWKKDLEATREKMACRIERRH